MGLTHVQLNQRQNS